MLHVNQGLPFHSTIVHREFIHIAYAFLFRRRLDCDKHTCQLSVIFFLFYIYTQKLFYVKKIHILKFKVLYRIQTGIFINSIFVYL